MKRDELPSTEPERVVRLWRSGELSREEASLLLARMTLELQKLVSRWTLDADRDRRRAGAIASGMSRKKRANVCAATFGIEYFAARARGATPSAAFQTARNEVEKKHGITRSERTYERWLKDIMNAENAT